MSDVVGPPRRERRYPSNPWGASLLGLGLAWVALTVALGVRPGGSWFLEAVGCYTCFGIIGAVYGHALGRSDGPAWDRVVQAARFAAFLTIYGSFALFPRFWGRVCWDHSGRDLAFLGFAGGMAMFALGLWPRIFRHVMYLAGRAPLADEKPVGAKRGGVWDRDLDGVGGRREIAWSRPAMGGQGSERP